MTPPPSDPNTCDVPPYASKNSGSGSGGLSGGKRHAPATVYAEAAFPVASGGPIRYANGGVLLNPADIMVPGGGFFSHVRHYCNQASDAHDGPNGFNWWVGSMPYIVASDTSVAVVFDPNNPYWFDPSGSDYVPRYGVVGVTLVEDTMAQTLTFFQTVNGQQEVTVFNDLTVWPNPGGLISHTDSGGILSTATIDTDGTISQLQRSFTAGGSTVTESLFYAYISSGSAVGKLQTVTFQRAVGAGAPDPAARALYEYCGTSDANGSLNDLKSVSQQIPDGTGGWVIADPERYRYYLGGESTGIIHGLKMHFGPEACRALVNAGIDLDTAADSVVKPYADHYFEYDPTSGSVTKEIAAVCPGCPGGGNDGRSLRLHRKSQQSLARLQCLGGKNRSNTAGRIEDRRLQ